MPGFQTIFDYLHESNVTVQSSCNMHLFECPAVYVEVVELSVYHLDEPNVFHTG